MKTCIDTIMIPACMHAYIQVLNASKWHESPTHAPTNTHTHKHTQQLQHEQHALEQERDSLKLERARLAVERETYYRAFEVCAFVYTHTHTRTHTYALSLTHIHTYTLHYMDDSAHSP